MAKESAEFCLDLVPLERKAELWLIFQEYLAELAPYTGANLVDGVYPYAYFDAYWQEPDNRWFYAMSTADGEVSGFAMVHFNDDRVFYIAEFCILPAWRGSGLGKGMLEKIMKRHRGDWKLGYVKSYDLAAAFWQRAFAEKAGCKATEVVHNGIPRIELLLQQGG